jgi:hypothetical protein
VGKKLNIPERGYREGNICGRVQPQSAGKKVMKILKACGKRPYRENGILGSDWIIRMSLSKPIYIESLWWLLKQFYEQGIFV